jgi:drug/metabolite transporter (DMT)-like permease
MAVSALGFCSMAVFVKRLSPQLPGFELVFFRSLINLVLVLAWMRGQIRSVKPSGVLFGRGVAGFIGIVCLFYSVSHLPLPVAMLMSWSSPIFVLIFSRVFLKERVARRSLLWIVGVFLGLDLLLGRVETDAAVLFDFLPILIGLTGACCAGLAYVAVRAASQRQISSSTIVLYLAGVSTILSLPLALADFKIPSGNQWTELFALGCLATVGQVAMTRAYRYARAGVVSTMGLLNAVFSSLFGWMLFGETLGAWQWVGLSIMTLSLAGLSFAKLVKNTQPG